MHVFSPNHTAVTDVVVHLPAPAPHIHLMTNLVPIVICMTLSLSHETRSVSVESFWGIRCNLLVSRIVHVL